MVKPYLDQYGDTVLQRKIGPKILSCYYNSASLSDRVQQKICKAFNIVEPDVVMKATSVITGPMATEMHSVAQYDQSESSDSEQWEQ